METNMDDVLTAMAAHIEALPGIKKVFANFPYAIEDAETPCVILEPQTADIAQDQPGSDQMWTPTIVAHILYPMTGQTFQEMNIVNALVEPIVDAFSMGAEQRTLQAMIANLPSRVYRLMPVSAVYSTQLRYGQFNYAQAEVTISAKWHRRPGS